MNTSNITNYNPKDFAELLGVSVKMVQRRNSKSKPWAEGLILRADGYETAFYKKD